MVAFETSLHWLSPPLLYSSITFWGQEFKSHLCSHGFASFFLANAILQLALAMPFFGAQHFTEVLKDLFLPWYEGIGGRQSPGWETCSGKRNISVQVEVRPVPGQQLAVMEQKEKAQTVLLESEKEEARQDHAPASPPLSKKTPTKQRKPR